MVRFVVKATYLRIDSWLLPRTLRYHPSCAEAFPDPPVNGVVPIYLVTVSGSQKSHNLVEADHRGAAGSGHELRERYPLCSKKYHLHHSSGRIRFWCRAVDAQEGRQQYSRLHQQSSLGNLSDLPYYCRM